MARKLRVEYEGAIYHVMNRGDRKEPIFNLVVETPKANLVGGMRISRKGDPAKVKLAQRLRAETTMTLNWIAQRLQMGTKTHLAHLLYWETR